MSETITVKKCLGCKAELRSSDPAVCKRCDTHGSPDGRIQSYSERCP